MGLLEKVQQKKVSNKGKTELKNTETLKNNQIRTIGLLEKAKQKKQPLTQKQETTKKEKKTKSQTKTLGLLEKAKQKKQYITTEKIEGGKKDIIEKKEGFGWKGLGTRRIVFNHLINEYVYEVSEPVLTDLELEIKEELSRLFKMLADINISNMDKPEKEKYLGETLEQIIKDNNIKFSEQKKSIKKEDSKIKGKKTFKDIFKFKKKDKLINIKKPTLTKVELNALEKESKDKIFYHLFREYLGYGKIDIIMEDTGIEDISCDGHHVPVFIYHKKYDAIATNIKFDNENELNSFVVRLSQICGKQISIYSPIVDGKLPDGSRLQTTLARTVTKESTFTIRKFKENPLTPVDLIGFQSLSFDMAAYFWMAIERGASILFCGGTASGKTTALNALSLFIPPQSKIVSIEDTREVNLPHKNWIAGTTRQGFSVSDEKTGKDIDMFDLIRAALRQRPKVIIVGEVRGKEAYSLFQAMSTGHTSYATVHASDIHTLIQRLENPPISLPRALLTSLDVIVFQNVIDITGKTVRRMTSVTEIVKLDPDTNQLIFMEPFRWVSKTDDRFESSGSSKILNTIRIQNDWTEEQLEKELDNRKLILKWMIQKEIRDYKDVGQIVSNYIKNPDELLKKAREEVKN
ncbi:MAG: secretion system protein E [Candidatus Dadabacteria bacterium]|nr:secretion system protein E [Candidatus Dadabacteria bacterium]